MKIFCHPDHHNCLKLLIPKEMGCLSNVALESVHPSSIIVPYLSSPRLPVLLLDDGELIFSENAACTYLTRKAGEAPPTRNQEVEMDYWLEWEMTVLRKCVIDVSSLLPHLYSLNSALSGSHLIREAGLTAADICVWVTLLPVLGAEPWGATSSLWEGLDHLRRWFKRLEEHPAFKVSIEKLLSAPRPSRPYNTLEAKFGPEVKTTAAPPKKTKEGPRPKQASPATNGFADGEEAQVQDGKPLKPGEIEAVISSWQPTCSHPDPRPPAILAPRQHPIAPLPGEKNILITSALPYVNNVPHLGNIIGCVLSADVFSRYCRMINENVLFVCGTDEYGTATETKALEEGTTPQQICDKYNAIHAEIYDWFNIDFDFFGRTTTEKQTEIAQDIFWKLYNNGLILKEAVDQLYCGQCDKFLADRFVEGVCPFPGCDYEDARGDQCDKCGKLINATELKSARCKVCNATPSVRTSNHLFLDLPNLEPRLQSHLDSVFENGLWTSNAKLITKSWLRDGLKPRCITRDLKWGTRVPLEGYQDKVFYVWFDAPVGYLSITANYTDAWEAWWKNPKHVQLFQFMAKDNVPFHSVIFPSSQLGTKDDYTIVNHLVATEYLNYEDGKFSKSRGVGVFGNDAKETGIPADVWRFYLLYVRPESQDSAFNWVDFATKNNSELLNNLGNFLNRPFPFIVSKFDGSIPPLHLEKDDVHVIAAVNRELENYHSLLAAIKLRDAIRSILSISAIGNKYIQDNEPWRLIKGSPSEQQRARTVIAVAANLGCLLGILLGPYMPETSHVILETIVNQPKAFALPRVFVPFLPEGHKIGTPMPLFKKIENDHINELKSRFGGQSAKSSSPVSPEEIAKLTADVAKQGEVVRDLKASKAAKADINLQVAVLLELKQKLAAASGEPLNKPDDKKKQAKQKSTPAAAKPTADAAAKPTAAAAAPPAAPPVVVDQAEVDRLTKLVQAQGELVREVKARQPVDKESISKEVAVLLELKKQMAVAAGTDPNAIGGVGGRKKKQK